MEVLAVQNSGKCGEKMTEDLELIPGRFIGEHHPCFIIAEIGQNHQGNIDIAKKLIQVAKDCGADCVKFQKSYLLEKFNHVALARPYNSPNSWGPTYGEHKKFLEFSNEEFLELQRYAEEDVKIAFTASAMDMVSADLLDKMNVPFIKIGSGDTNNFPFLEYVAHKKRPMVISTGMQIMSTVQEVYRRVKAINPQFCLLQCTSAYPTPPNDAHLRVITTYKKEFPDVHIGYSGHEHGISISLAAVALGAKVLERHITLDKNWKGSDHKCSLEPAEFQQLVEQVRIVESALGSPQKTRQTSEEPCYRKLGKTIVASRRLDNGTVLQINDLKIKVAEPKGWSAEKLDNLIGRRVKRCIEEDESICESDMICGEWL